MTQPDDPPLTSAQHARIKRASPYAYRQHQAREAAARESRRCVCEIDPEIAPGPIVTAAALESSQRRRLTRASEPTQQAYTILHSMLEPEIRRAVNSLLTDGADHDIPGFALVYHWVGHLAPLGIAEITTCLQLLVGTSAAAGRAPGEPVSRKVYMDAAGAHMWPSCPHSDLWRCTRPMAHVLRHHARTGRWPERLAPFGGFDPTPVRRVA